MWAGTLRARLPPLTDIHYLSAHCCKTLEMKWQIKSQKKAADKEEKKRTFMCPFDFISYCTGLAAY